MFKYPKSLDSLIDSFSMLPGVGKKTAERYAFAVLNQLKQEDVEEFIENLKNVKQNLHACPRCGMLTEADICEICQDESRDQTTILVVEQVRDVFVIEGLGEYKGLYHILNGAIAFSKGIGVNDLNIDSLLMRINNGVVKEIILATNATLEGETTALYLKELLNDHPEIKVTRLAHGLPVGGDLLYADQLTLIRALEGRNTYK